MWEAQKKRRERNQGIGQLCYLLLLVVYVEQQKERMANSMGFVR